VVVGAAGREAGGAGLQGSAQQALHRGDVGWCGDLLCQRTLAHHGHAQGVVRHQGQEVRAVRHGLQHVQVVAKTAPVEPDAFGQCRAGDVFHAFHQRDQFCLAAWHAGREGDATVAHQQRGHAMMDAGAEGLIPGRLAVVVGVDVDEAGGQPGPAAVDALAYDRADAADLGDEAVLHADVGGEGGGPRAVDDGGPFNHPIEHPCASTASPVSCR
jgi:hypothetical protein